MESKKEIREIILSKRNLISKTDIMQRSDAITAKIMEMPNYKETTQILAYIGFGSEVRLQKLLMDALKKDKEVYLPRCIPNTREMEFYRIYHLEKDLEEGPWGIHEPKENLHRLDCIADKGLAIIPGVAFDLHCNRVGYGGGYYDRFLPKLPIQWLRIGVAFDEQIVEKIPKNYFDIPIDCVITDKYLYNQR